MARVSELYIYPVKSLGGFQVDSAVLTDRGFEHDRRWMLIDKNNDFLTQREHPQMASLQTSITNEGIKIFLKKDNAQSIIFPLTPLKSNKITVRVWDDTCEAIIVDPETDKWFSEMLSMECRLVYMPENSLRKVEAEYALQENDITSFSDGYPILMIGKESLLDLNKRLPESLPMNRFRPNIVFEAGEPYEEDVMEYFIINGINFYGVKLCARCVMTTINQDTSIKNKEPLKTLATYRMSNNKIYFGQNVLFAGTGIIKTRDELTIITRKEKPVFEVK